MGAVMTSCHGERKETDWTLNILMVIDARLLIAYLGGGVIMVGVAT